MRKRAKKYNEEAYDFSDASPEELKEKENLWWTGACIDLGIPFKDFDNNPNGGYPAISTFLASRLHGKTMTYPLIIESGIGQHFRRDVVVNWGTENGTIFLPGYVIDAGKVRYLSIANEKYFDFSK